jgi:hypothetical protein
MWDSRHRRNFECLPEAQDIPFHCDTHVDVVSVHRHRWHCNESIHSIPTRHCIRASHMALPLFLHLSNHVHFPSNTFAFFSGFPSRMLRNRSQQWTILTNMRGLSRRPLHRNPEDRHEASLVHMDLCCAWRSTAADSTRAVGARNFAVGMSGQPLGYKRILYKEAVRMTVRRMNHHHHRLHHVKLIWAGWDCPGPHQFLQSSQRQCHRCWV